MYINTPIICLIVGCFFIPGSVRCPGVLLLIEGGIVSTLPARQLAVTFVIPATRFIVLTIEEVEGFDDTLFVQGRCLQGHHLALFSRKSGSTE